MQSQPWLKLAPLLAIVLLTLLATAVFCFSALATTPECWRAPAEPRVLEMKGSSSSGPIQRFLHHNDHDGAGQLQLYSADSPLVLASLHHWPLSDSTGAAAAFYARPEPLDSDYDGLIDHLITTDIIGRIWLTQVNATGFGPTRLLADLAQPDWRFIASAGVMEVSLPSLLRPDGLAGRHHKLLLIARNITTGEDALFTLRLPTYVPLADPIEFDALFDRTVLTEIEREEGLSSEQWRNIVNSAGWWARLSGQVTQPPKVVAGVIYSAVAGSDFNAEVCADQSAEHDIVAMQLHSGGLVYSQRRFRLLNGEGQLKLLQQPDGTAALVLDNTDEQQLVLSDLQMISSACQDCTEQLKLDEFPRWLKLATYRHETGAH
ncbi:hypothetical protein [Arsukibacterium sp.]|uniref:hypothetical protein n=1 Tax=Arsukibacterium sp. TaxID=1977258 RepID=UPI00356A9D70